MNFEVLEDSSDSSDDEDEKKKLHSETVGSKMTKKKKTNMKKILKQMKRKDKRRNKTYFSADFLPLDIVRNPGDFAERLFTRLRSSNERIEVKIYLMKLIARLIGRHKLIILEFYPYLLKYINPHQRAVAEILAIVAESVHDQIPPDDITPVVEKIIDQYVSEQTANEKITIAINAIREICIRCPHGITENQLHHTINFKDYKNKSIAAATKSLINLFRDINPKMLEKKTRGKMTSADANYSMAFGEYEYQKQKEIKEGLKLLAAYEGWDSDEDILANRILTELDFKKMKLLRLRKKDEKKEINVNSIEGYEIIDDRFTKKNFKEDGLPEGF